MFFSAQLDLSGRKLSHPGEFRAEPPVGTKRQPPQACKTQAWRHARVEGLSLTIEMKDLQARIEGNAKQK